jgi:hypothetical protein
MFPVGPEGPIVYWVRRAVLVLAVIAALLALRWVFFGRGDSGSDQGAAPVSSVSPAATSTNPNSPAPVDTAAAKPSTESSAVQCADSDLSVTVSTDSASYPVGSTPKLHLKIENTSGTACYRDIGAGMNELKISSGGYHVWSSDDCNAGGAPLVTLLKPTQSYSVTVTWPGVLSAKGCPANQPMAKPGLYDLYGRNGTLISASSSFSLTN